MSVESSEKPPSMMDVEEGFHSGLKVSKTEFQKNKNNNGNFSTEPKTDKWLFLNIS